MWNMLCCLALLATAPPQTGQIANFSGKLAQSSQPDAGQSFRVSVLVAESGDPPSWPVVVEEDWTSADWHHHLTRMNDAALRYPHASGSVRIGLTPAWFDTSQWKAGYQWQAGDGGTYEVVERETAADRAVWQVRTSARRGVQRSFAVDSDSGWVLRGKATVFMGRGERYELSWQLDSPTELAADQVQTLEQAWDQLLPELEAWQSSEATGRDAASTALRKKLAQPLQRIEEVAEWPAAKAAAQQAQQQLRTSGTQRNALAAMAQRIQRKNVSDTEFYRRDGAAVKVGSQTGKVLVLHFWDYRAEPLRPPYGQVGYLDFLHRRFADQPVTVAGVVVNPRLGDPLTRGNVARSARKLAEFMNLGYPLWFDDQYRLKQWGDPRSAGAALPLFVVIDTTGSVVEYHAGHYDVDRDRGLKQLDDVVSNLLAEEMSETDQ